MPQSIDHDHCVVPEKIYTYPMEGHWKFLGGGRGGGGGVLNFKILRGKHEAVKPWNEIPSHITDLPKKTFKMVLCQNCFLISWKKKIYDYIEIPMIIKNIGLTK